MNIIIFTDDELKTGLLRHDRRVQHILKILKKGPGDDFFAGTFDGKTGKATIVSFDRNMMHFAFRPDSEATSLYPVWVIMGFPRPIQANRVLRELSSLGVSRIFLCGSDLGEKSYLDSSCYKHGRYVHALVEGAEQSGNPRIPDISTHPNLDSVMNLLLDTNNFKKIALDPGITTNYFNILTFDGQTTILAVGNERGWTERELNLLKFNNFHIASLGKRILRTETAAVVAVALTLAKLKLC